MKSTFHLVAVLFLALIPSAAFAEPIVSIVNRIAIKL
jgi:hypothetical protein